MYESYLDKDHGKVGAMLRHMTGDVAKAFKEDWAQCYADEKGHFDELAESCVKWHWMVVKYSKDPYMMRKYVFIIQTAFDFGVNLDKFKSWKRMMRVILPEEFFEKMRSFTTQVPQIAVMDETEFKDKKKGEIRDASEVLW